MSVVADIDNKLRVDEQERGDEMVWIVVLIRLFAVSSVPMICEDNNCVTRLIVEASATPTVFMESDEEELEMGTTRHGVGGMCARVSVDMHVPANKGNSS